MTLNILTFQNLPIFDQLCLEESLLRANSDNWVLINIGSPKAIVMGISTKPEDVIDLSKTTKDNIPIIQRFSGGGTVIVDENTLFVTFIFQKNTHTFELYPKTILEWTAAFLKKSLPLPHFALQESDFTLYDKKIGGNAQYIKKDRWLHHTSFLWDFSPHNMNYLLHPKKEPSYRQGRSHLDFITKLSPHISKKEFEIHLLSSFASHYNTIFNPPIPHFSPHRQSTKLF